MLERKLRELNIVIKTQSNSGTRFMLNRYEDACDQGCLSSYVYNRREVGRPPNAYHLPPGYTNHGISSWWEWWASVCHEAGLECWSLLWHRDALKASHKITETVCHCCGQNTSIYGARRWMSDCWAGESGGSREEMVAYTGLCYYTRGKEVIREEMVAWVQGCVTILEGEKQSLSKTVRVCMLHIL